MKKYLIYLFVILSLKLFSQNIKTYDGNYKDSYNLSYGSDGKATYKYYENENYERIFHGNFNYISTLGKNDKTTIQGEFRENKKVGKWIYFRGNANNYLKIYGNYINGLKNGVWSFYKSSFINNQMIETLYSLNFKNNILIGEIKIPNLIGTFDPKGNFVGNWAYKSGNKEILAQFENNVLVKFIDRESSTGEIYSKYIPNQDSIYSVLQNLNLIEFKKVKLEELPNFDKVFNVSENNYSKNNQSTSIKKFYALVQGTINILMNNTFFFLDYTNINSPELLVNNSEIKIQVIEPKKEVQQEIEVQSEEQKEKDADRRKKLDKLIETDPNANGYYGNGSGGGGGDYQLGNRKPVSRPKPDYICDEEGLVVVSIEVNVYGKVIKATPGIKGSTNTAACLLSQAKESALNTTWQPDANAPSKQIGVIKYRFSLSQ